MNLELLKEADTVICKNHGFQSAVIPYSVGYFIKFDLKSEWPIVRFQCGSIELVDPADIK